MAVLFTINAEAQKATRKVTHGKSTFTLYSPVKGLEPTPVCGFAPPVAGASLKSSHYGAGTYFQYAPGKIYQTNYKCLMTELQNWLYYPVGKAMELAEQKGFKQVDEKAWNKKFKKSYISIGVICYEIADNKWVQFHTNNLNNEGPYSLTGSSDDYVTMVSYIEMMPQDADYVLDRLYRFWNDGVHIADRAGINHKNLNTQPTPPSSPTPNLFAITDYLFPDKGYSVLLFEDGKPKYSWVAHKTILEGNIIKPDFSADGYCDYNDLNAAYGYEVDIRKCGKEIYALYNISAPMSKALEPGMTWARHMKNLIEYKRVEDTEIAKLQRANAAAFERMYKEIFK